MFCEIGNKDCEKCQLGREKRKRCEAKLFCYRVHKRAIENLKICPDMEIKNKRVRNFPVRIPLEVSAEMKDKLAARSVHMCVSINELIRKFIKERLWM